MNTYFILKSSPVQNYLVHTWSAYFSKQLKTEVRIGAVDFGIWHIILEDVSIKDLHNSSMLNIDKLTLNIRNIKTKKKELILRDLTVNQALINVRKYKTDSIFNYQFLVDYFSSKDTLKKTSENKWKVILRTLNIKSSKLSYQVDNKPLIKFMFDPNHVDLTDLNIRIKNIDFSKDSIKADIKKVSFKEKNGLTLNKLSCQLLYNSNALQLKNLILNTASSHLALSILLKYNSPDDFNNFISKVYILSYFKESKLNTKDLGYFIPELYGMDDNFKISGEISGKINSIFGKYFKINYGRATEFDGNFSFKGLPDFEKTYINFNANKLHIIKKDLESFILPSNRNSLNNDNSKPSVNHIILPDLISMLGNVKIKGNFSGYYNDFISTADITTDIGRIKTDISLKKNSASKQFEYVGKINASNFDLSKLTSLNDFGRIDFKLNIDGSGFDTKNLMVDMTGIIDTLYFKKYKYRDISLEGGIHNQKFEGYFKVKDPNLYLDFNGIIDLTNPKPVMNFAANIQNANLNKLNLLKSDSISKLSTLLKVNMEGDKIDNLEGELEINDTRYSIGKQIQKLDNLLFTSTKDNNSLRVIKLKSDYIDADVTGYYMFSQLYNSFSNLINAYIPSFYKIKKKKESENLENKEKVPEQNFEYTVKLKNTKALSKLFIPWLKIADSTEIKGKYNSNANTFTVKGNSSHIDLKNNRFKNCYLDAIAQNGVILLNTGCSRMFITDSLWLDNLKLGTFAKNDTLNYKISWDNHAAEKNTKADITGNISFSSAPKIFITILPSKVLINDSLWAIEKGNKIIIDSSSVSVDNFSFIFNNQRLAINGKISHNPSDKLNIEFKNFNISQLDYYMESQNIDFDGVLNADISIYDIYKAPRITSSINIKNLSFNHDKLGELNINSSYDAEKVAVYSTAELLFTGDAETVKPISLTGYYYPESKTQNFDINAKIDNLHLKWLGRYLADFASNLNGYASGDIQLKGTLADPELTGKMRLMRTKLKIDYLNTEYTLNGNIDLNKNDISFNNIEFFGNNSIDPKNSKAWLNGKIYHKFFNKMRLDLNIKTQNLTCLNTNASLNNLYYGTAIASGTIKITGNVDKIFMNIDARTEKGTVLTIPLTTTEELTENNFITFIGNSPKSKPHNYSVNLNGVQLNFDLDVTPDAEIQLEFDKRIGDIIRANGKGDIKLEINTNGDFNMFGDYVVEKGDYLFTLKKIINKKFIIEKGGRISWSGNPYAGTIDLKAIYNLTTAIDILRPDLTPTNRKIPVNCNIFLTEYLLKPTINFSITFPELSNDFSLEPYKIAIEPELNKQVFSLLVLRSFSTPSQFKGNETTSTSNALNSNSFELLSNQFSNILSQISKDVDIGFKYRPSDQITSDQYELALKTQILNNRLLINTNLAYSADKKQQASNSTNSSNIVGDVNVEYKLTREGQIRIKAFNKSNINEYLYVNSPYTQGVGIFYRKEFDLFKDIFRRKRFMTFE